MMEKPFRGDFYLKIREGVNNLKQYIATIDEAARSEMTYLLKLHVVARGGNVPKTKCGVLKHLLWKLTV